MTNISPDAIHLFHPFSVQHGSKRRLHGDIQEVIFYGESRFRTACAEISKAEPENRLWMQKILHREVMYILTYIGIGAALGLCMEVPIVVRSLAESFAFMSEDDLPVAMAPEFLATLDIGTSPYTHSRVVQDYHLAWWTEARPPKKQRQWLSNVSLVECINHHRNEVCNRADEDGNLIGMPISLAPSLPHSSDPGAGADLRPLTAHLIDELPGLHSFVAAMQTSHENNWELAMRRASGFFQLHEQAVRKEMAGDDQSATAGSSADASLPEGSRKWTWGESLTKSDVLGVDRYEYRHKQRPMVHSGYHETLESDMDDGYDSPHPRFPRDSGAYSDISPTAAAPPPPTEHGYSDYFCRSDKRMYDPIRRPLSISTTSGNHSPEPITTAQTPDAAPHSDAVHPARHASPGHNGTDAEPISGKQTNEIVPSALAALALWVEDKDGGHDDIIGQDAGVDVAALAASWSFSDDEDAPVAPPTKVLRPAGNINLSELAATWDFSDDQARDATQAVPPAIIAALLWSEDEDEAEDKANTAPAVAQATQTLPPRWPEIDADDSMGTHPSFNDPPFGHAFEVAADWIDDASDPVTRSGGTLASNNAAMMAVEAWGEGDLPPIIADDTMSDAGTTLSTNSDMAVNPRRITLDMPPDYIPFAPHLDVALFKSDSSDSSDEDALYFT